MRVRNKLLRIWPAVTPFPFVVELILRVWEFRQISASGSR